MRNYGVIKYVWYEPDYALLQGFVITLTTLLSTQRVCPPPRTKGGGYSPGGEGAGRQYFGRRQT
jgi:hypothetical protein